MGRYCAAAASGSTRRNCFFHAGAMVDVVMQRPMMPIFMPPMSRTTYGTEAPIVLPFASRTFDRIQVNFDSAMRCFRTSMPKSNSWLPRTA